MPIDPEVKNTILARCARHCAICRRFRPTRIQIHHIVERSDVGSDDPDNLIPTCISCHTDVHSHIPFTQRFTPEELKMHRDNVYRLVSEGKLRATEDDHASNREVLPSAGSVTLDPVAVGLLLDVTNSKTGELFMVETSAGLIMKTSGKVILEGMAPPRHAAQMRHALEALLNADLLRTRSQAVVEATHEGYCLADDIESGNLKPEL